LHVSFALPINFLAWYAGLMKTEFLSHRVIVLVLGLGLLTAGCTNERDSSGSPQSSTGNAALSPLPREPEKTIFITPKPPEPVVARDDSKAEARELREPRREEEEPMPELRSEEKEVPPESPPPIPDSFKAMNKEKNLFFEKKPDGTRRVHVLAEVCLREGPLEVFLCKWKTKEHESILSADLDVRDIHFALIAAGAKPGSTVRFVPRYKPATGSEIKVTVTYNKDGKLLTKPAQYWVLDTNTKKDMPHGWVFAGSRFFKDPDDPDKAPYYCANNGEVICIANFQDSMMDLPVKSSKEQAELGFAANTERIPPLKTKVLVTLEVVPAKK
jgi:hypothetical protein